MYSHIVKRKCRFQKSTKTVVMMIETICTLLCNRLHFIERDVLLFVSLCGAGCLDYPMVWMPQYHGVNQTNKRQESLYSICPLKVQTWISLTDWMLSMFDKVEEQYNLLN